MRRSHYLVIILLLIAQTSFGQIYQNMAQPGYKFSRARFDSVLTIPTGLGNLKNISGGQDTGQIRFNKSDSSVYVWNGRAWIKAGGGTIPTLTQVLESAAGANEAGANQIKDLFAGTSQNDAATFGQLTDTANLRLRISDTATMLTPYSRVKSVGLSMPSAFYVANSPLTSNGTLAVTGAGTAAQYVRGDGQLATFPSSSSGGSSVAYYLNGSVSQGTIGGSVYYEMNKTPIIGAGTDFSKAGNGLISQFITDVADPNRLEIPAGNWNFEMYFSASSSGGTPAFYVELLKYDGTTFTSIASSSVNPEAITNGTTIDLYVTAFAIPQTTLLATDRLAIRVYIVNSTGGRTITMHTENSHLCEIITNFAGGIAALNGLTANTQYFATGTSGTDFAISSLTDTHTFNLPTASATNRGALSSADWSTFNGKTTVTSYGKNAGGDSTILLLSNGTRYAAKDSVGGGGGMAIGGTITSATAGSALFAGTSGVLAQDNANYFWDNTNKRLGIGTATPAHRLDVVGGETRLFPRGIINGSFIFTHTDVYNKLNMNNTYNIIQQTNASGWMDIASAADLYVGAGSGKNLYLGYDIENGRSSNVTVGATTAAAASAILEVRSTTKGVLFPRMTTTQRNAISSPATGLLIFNNDSTTLHGYNGTNWQKYLTPNAAGNVGINTTTDAGYRLDVNGTARVSGNTLISNPANVNNVLELKNSQLNKANVLSFLSSDGSTQGGFVATGPTYAYGTYQPSQTTMVGGTGGVAFKVGNGANQHIRFHATNSDADLSTVQQQMFASTGNVHFQNGGTYTDIPSARIAVNSTTQGVLFPRMTTVQKLAIGTPAAGLQVYDSTLNQMSYYNGTTWVNF